MFFPKEEITNEKQKQLIKQKTVKNKKEKYKDGVNKRLKAKFPINIWILVTIKNREKFITKIDNTYSHCFTLAETRILFLFE